MKKSVICMFFASLLAGASAQAGNEAKKGTVGATELQINPWARSAGWAGSNTAKIRGVESINHNIGGLSYIEGTEVLFSTSKYLVGSDININAFGLGQQLGENGGVLGLSVVSLDLGKIQQTTVDNPDQDVILQASIMNLGLSYSKTFSNSIHGGITVRVVSESLPNASAFGIAFDGGVQYVTSLGSGELDQDNLHIGVSLRNVGPEMRYSGDGLSYRGQVNNGSFFQTLEQRTDNYEMPAMLNIGLAYDWNFNSENRLTMAGNFVSNTASNDQFLVGAEYAFMEKFMVRAGLDYQKGLFGDNADYIHSGPTFGATVDIPFNFSKGSAVDPNAPIDAAVPAKVKNRTFGFDYAFRPSNVLAGTHSVSIKLGL